MSALLDLEVVRGETPEVWRRVEDELRERIPGEVGAERCNIYERRLGRMRVDAGWEVGRGDRVRCWMFV